MSKGGAPCPHFENGKYTLPFWTPESGTLSFSEHLNIENYIITDISDQDLYYLFIIKP